MEPSGSGSAPEASAPRPPLAGRNLWFLHIPKCAGIALFEALREALPGDSHFLDIAASTQAARRVRWGLEWASFFEQQWEMLAYQLLYHMERDCRLIGGHYPFCSAARFWYGERYALATILRDPVERMISHLQFMVIVMGRHPARAYDQGEADPLPELEALLASDYAPWMARSYQLYLGGLDGENRGRIAGSLERAIARLAQIEVLGFHHNLAAFARSLEWKTGLSLRIERHNNLGAHVSNPQVRARMEDFCQSHLRRIRQLCESDQRIYDAATDRFPEML